MPRLIACDESGYEGPRLVGGVTDVFAHASVHLDTDTADACVTELRRRIRSPAQEYKANHLLREKHRGALDWLLGPAGPLHGRARVYLVDKTHLAATAPDGPDLLVRAIAAAVAHWGDGGPVAVVHDRQPSLTTERIASIAGLAGIEFVDSRTDARVQVADFVAGVARRATSDDLAGRGDARLVAALRPFVDPTSIWGDEKSWSRLTGSGRVDLPT